MGQVKTEPESGYIGLIDHCQEPVLGVPTHYQNDGSFLYLLTSALFPPSLECVHQWILQSSEKSGMDVPIGMSNV